MHVAHLPQGHVVPLGGQRAGHDAVVGEVLLQRAAGHHRRHRRRVPGRPQHRVDAAHHPGVAGEAAFVRVVPGVEERAGLQEQRVQAAGVLSLGVQHGKRPQARPDADEGTGRHLGAQPREDREAQRPGVRAVRGVALVAVTGPEQGGPHRWQVPGRHQRREVRRQAGEPVVLRPVVHHQQRCRGVVVEPGRRPQRHRHLAVQRARDDHQVAAPAGGPGPGQPARPVVAGQLQDRLVAERTGHPPRVRRVGQGHRGAVGVGELEQVLHPVDVGPLDLEQPAVPVVPEVEPVPGDPHLLVQPDRAQRVVRVVEAEGHGVLPDHRPRVRRQRQVRGHPATLGRPAGWGRVPTANDPFVRAGTAGPAAGRLPSRRPAWPAGAPGSRPAWR